MTSTEGDRRCLVAAHGLHDLLDFSVDNQVSGKVNDMPGREVRIDGVRSNKVGMDRAIPLH